MLKIKNIILTLISIISLSVVNNYGMDVATDSLKKEFQKIEKKFQEIKEQIEMYEAMNLVLSYEVKQIHKKLNLRLTINKRRLYTSSLSYKVSTFSQNTREIDQLKQECFNIKEKIQELLTNNTMFLKSVLSK
jgi:hypothetical protein